MTDEATQRAAALKAQIAAAQQELAKIAAEEAIRKADIAPAASRPFAERNRYGHIRPGSRRDFVTGE